MAGHPASESIPMLKPSIKGSKRVGSSEESVCSFNSKKWQSLMSSSGTAFFKKRLADLISSTIK